MPAPAVDASTATSSTLVVRTDIADILATPLFADALAAAIVRYGRSVRGSMAHAEAPLEVYDLAPGQGLLAVRLLRALHRQLDDAGLGWSVRLHLCARPHPLGRTGRDHPLLREAMARGELTWGSRDPVHQGLPYVGAPAVFLALGYFQQLPVQLRAAHYTQWLEGHIERQPRDAQGDWPLGYRWSPHTEQPGDTTLQALRSLYLHKLGSTAVNLPHTGLRVLRRIAACTRGQYLLLAADTGAANLRDIETGALTPPAIWRDGVSAMPVNFHALAHAQPHAHTTHYRSSSDGPLLQVALVGTATDAQFLHIAAPLRDGADHGLLAREQAAWLTADAPAAVWLSHLQRCAFDPRTLREHPVGAAAPQPLDTVERSAWREALERAWLLAQDEADAETCVALGMRAAHLSLWGLAVRVLQPMADQLPPLARDYLVLAQLQAGQLDAIAAATLAPGESPDGQATWLEYACLHRADCQALAWYDATLARDDELCLEPLAVHHAQAWLEQYRDPHIGIMTRLPELPSLEEVQAWIGQQRADPSRVSFAVLHREHGFVGSVCYQRAGDSGYFHFWIGTDHQNRGLGRRAGRLLQLQAERAGVTCLYTSAYRDNPRSLAALAAIGFMPLAIQAVAPDDDLRFFATALTDGHAPNPDGLKQLCLAIDSPMRFHAQPGKS